MIKIKKEKIKATLMLFVSQLAFIGLLPFPVFGGLKDGTTASVLDGSGGTVNRLTGAAEAVGNMIKIIFPIFRVGGIVLLVCGLAQFILAMKDETVEPKVKAATLIIVGICLITLKSLTGGLLAVLGVGDIF